MAELLDQSRFEDVEAFVWTDPRDGNKVWMDPHDITLVLSSHDAKHCGRQTVHAPHLVTHPDHLDTPRRCPGRAAVDALIRGDTS